MKKIIFVIILTLIFFNFSFASDCLEDYQNCCEECEEKCFDVQYLDENFVIDANTPVDIKNDYNEQLEKVLDCFNDNCQDDYIDCRNFKEKNSSKNGCFIHIFK